MKIARITKKALLEAMTNEQLAVAFTDAADPDRTPGTVGISRTAAGNYMVYCVNEAAKLYHTSVHANRREANGRCLERMRVVARNAATLRF